MWGENVCIRTDEVWEPILEVSATNFEIALHMGVTGCPPNWEAKGWGKRNRPWGFGRAPWHFESRLISRRGCQLLAGTLLYQDLWSKADWHARLPISAHPWSAEEASSSSVEQDHIIIRQGQTRMRRPNIKDIKMKQNGNRSTWISDSLSQWKPPWLEVLSRGTST